jgi:hypothetical protein
MPTAKKRRPDRSARFLLILAGVAAAATLPHGCAGPAWRNTLCAAAAAAGAVILGQRSLPFPALPPVPRILAAMAGLMFILHAFLAAAGRFPDNTAVAEAFAFRTGLVAFAVASWLLLRDPRARRTIASAAAIVAVVQIGVGLLAPDPLAASSVTSSWRLRGTFSSGNSLGSFLALVLPLLAGWLPRLARERGLSAHRIRQAVHQGHFRGLLPAAALATAVLIVTAGLILTGSRGALLAALAGCALALAPQLRGQSRRVRIALPLGMLAVCMTLLLAGGRFSVAEARWHALKSLDETAGRPEIWASLAPLLRQYPLGVGIGGLRGIAHTLQPAMYDTTRLLEAHSDPFEILLEFGLLPGLVLLSLFGLLVVPPLLRAPSGEPGVRAGMAGAVLAGVLHGLVDFNLLWRPGVALWFLLCLGGILRAPNGAPAGIFTRRAIAGFALAAALVSAFFGIQHFRAEWWREKAGGRRDPAMVWLREPIGAIDAMPVPSLSFMTADAAARMGSAWIILRDRMDREALARDTAGLPAGLPVTGTFFARQFRWTEHAAGYDTLARNADRVLAHAPANADLRLVRDMAATRAWLATPDERPAPPLPSDPGATSRLLRIRAAYASLWLDRCRRLPGDLSAARRWLASLPQTHPGRRLLEAQNADMLAPSP